MLSLVTHYVGNDATFLPLDHIFDVVQDLPSDTWAQFEEESPHNQVQPTEDTSEVQPSEVCLAQLVDTATSEVLLSSLTRALLLADLSDEPTVPKGDSEQKKQSHGEGLTRSDTPSLLHMAEFGHSKPSSPSPECVQTCRTAQSAPLSVFRTSKVLPIRQFEGIMLDNGAAGTPSGLKAYLSYCEYANISPVLRPSNAQFVGLGKGVVHSLEKATIRMPLGKNTFIDFETDIVQQDIPIMFGLDQHKKHSCSSDEFHNTFTHHPSSTTVPVVVKNGHMFVQWNQSEVLFTRKQLSQLHDRFGHPSARSLMNVLKRAEMSATTKRILDDITNRCKACQTFARKPSTFQVSMPMDDIFFYHEIEVDLFWIDSKAVLHIIDRGTRYSVAKFVEKVSAEHLWNTIMDAWASLFTGFPQIISHDQGTYFTSDYFQSCCAEFGIVTKQTPTESHNYLALCERYHSIIRRVYQKIKSVHQGLPCEVILSLSVHAVNNTAVPDGIVPTLLVFGTMPRLPLPAFSSLPVPQEQRFEEMKTAREEMMSITAQRRIREALKAHTRKSQPFVPEEGQQVLVYREGTKRFEGPFIVHAYDNRKTVQLLVPNAAGQVKVVPFSLSAVKPLPLLSNSNADAAIDSATTTADTAGRADYRVLENALTLSELDTPVSGHEDVTEQLNSLQHSAYPVQIVQDTGPQVFQEEKKAELLQLLQKGTYEIVPAKDIPTGSVVLGSRFVLVVKEPDSANPRRKARFVILGHKDPEKGRIVHEAPTVTKASIRVLLILSRIHNYPVWSRDVKQAFVQSKENLKRDVYIRPPRNQSVLETLGAEPNSALRAIKPLYGLPEAPTNWWCTISAYHEAELKMQHCVLDPCLFFLHAEDTTSNDGIVIEGVQAILVDDTLGTGDSIFEQKESGVEQVFETKERSYLPFKFNGSHLELVKIDEDDWDAILHQRGVCEKARNDFLYRYIYPS